MLPPLPGSVIGPLEIEPDSATSQLNSEMRKPLKPSPLIVADMLPAGLGVICAALAVALAATTNAAVNSMHMMVFRITDLSP